jgi:hypothetical protein
MNRTAMMATHTLAVLPVHAGMKARNVPMEPAGYCSHED